MCANALFTCDAKCVDGSGAAAKSGLEADGDFTFGWYLAQAPEVIAECGHQYSVDWWGLGVLIYEMTTLERPFTEGDQMQTIVNIVNYTPDWAPAEHVSPQCRDLMMQLLTYNSVLRLGSLGGAQDVRDHPWFAGFDWKALQEQRMVAPMVPEIDGPGDLRFFQEYHPDTSMPDHTDAANDIIHDQSLFKDW